MATVTLIDAAEAKRRRAELVAGLGFDEHELRERAAEYLLTARELAVLNELNELDFLLGK